jgi:photosystem I subunit 11
MELPPLDEIEKELTKPMNGDPFIGMLETPITTAPIVTKYLSYLPCYRLGVSANARGVEVGLAHGFFMPGPFIKLGPQTQVEGSAEIAGCMSDTGLVLILTICLSMYGAVSFQRKNVIGVKTLNGRSLVPDELFSSNGWAEFTSGWVVGGLSGVVYCYLCTQLFPYYK